MFSTDALLRFVRSWEVAAILDTLGLDGVRLAAEDLTSFWRGLKSGLVTAAARVFL